VAAGPGILSSSEGRHKQTASFEGAERVKKPARGNKSGATIGLRVQGGQRYKDRSVEGKGLEPSRKKGGCGVKSNYHQQLAAKAAKRGAREIAGDAARLRGLQTSESA